MKLLSRDKHVMPWRIEDEMNNIAYLLLISFMPLSTALLGHYPLHRVALVVYGTNLVGATLMLALLFSLVVPVAGLALFLIVPLSNVLPYTLDRHFRARSEG